MHIEWVFPIEVPATRFSFSFLVIEACSQFQIAAAAAECKTPKLLFANANITHILHLMCIYV